MNNRIVVPFNDNYNFTFTKHQTLTNSSLKHILRNLNVLFCLYINNINKNNILILFKFILLTIIEHNNIDYLIKLYNAEKLINIKAYIYINKYKYINKYEFLLFLQKSLYNDIKSLYKLNYIQFILKLTDKNILKIDVEHELNYTKLIWPKTQIILNTIQNEYLNLLTKYLLEKHTNEDTNSIREDIFETNDDDSEINYDESISEYDSDINDDESVSEHDLKTNNDESTSDDVVSNEDDIFNNWGDNVDNNSIYLYLTNPNNKIDFYYNLINNWGFNRRALITLSEMNYYIDYENIHIKLSNTAYYNDHENINIDNAILYTEYDEIISDKQFIKRLIYNTNEYVINNKISCNIKTFLKYSKYDETNHYIYYIHDELFHG
jgi:hypothetical protein